MPWQRRPQLMVEIHHGQTWHPVVSPSMSGDQGCRWVLMPRPSRQQCQPVQHMYTCTWRESYNTCTCTCMHGERKLFRKLSIPQWFFRNNYCVIIFCWFRFTNNSSCPHSYTVVLLHVCLLSWNHSGFCYWAVILVDMLVTAITNTCFLPWLTVYIVHAPWKVGTT